MGDKQGGKYATFGARLRLERAKQKELYPKEKERYQNRSVAKMLGYSEVYLTKFYTGKQLLPDDAYKKLADFWGVRVEYLKCEDDQRTDTDLLSFLNENEEMNFTTTMAFLKSIGIVCKPFFQLRCKVSDIVNMWDSLQQYVENRDYVADCIKTSNEVHNTFSRAFAKFYDSFPITVNFKESIAPPLNYLKAEHVDDAIMQSIIGHAPTGINFEKDLQKVIAYIRNDEEKMYSTNLGDDDLNAFVNTTVKKWAAEESVISCCFNLYRNNKCIAKCSSQDLFRFIDEIKALSSCAFDALVARSEMPEQ